VTVLSSTCCKTSKNVYINKPNSSIYSLVPGTLCLLVSVRSKDVKKREGYSEAPNKGY
jgi:hypothetical protein